ncbi:CRISPR system endoribonuclease Csx1 [Methanocaldococcus lauensis]|uniref:CRISPR system endoribonuclease Csx1 n=1 Tax=Methanocaldococcus lauensis TaxID=2546128 RepID=A0A8D6SX30_9EURY|nr:CRISPR-associated CARF protein Csx1 [Methanocaldococcus lauensis]CAB3289529.1 CRISPR system endoribonuclease Csx1 [Methanocaldococcus lauensis]
MKNILIAPWGNFKSWREVEYTLGDIKKPSKTSVSVISEKIKPDKTYILVLDTLSNLNSDNYNDIVYEVKNDVENFIKNENLEIKNYETIVCPGVGSFPNGKFLGNLRDYYSFILYKLAKNISGNVHIHLDLTHGINYMPVLTYKAIRDILEILAIRNDAKLTVYNSDPYGGDLAELKIHIVEDSKIIPTYQFSGIQQHPLDTTEYTPKEKIGEIKKIINQNNEIKTLKLLKQNINAFLASIKYALPLVYSTFYVDYKIIEKIADGIIDSYFKYIQIDTDNKTLKRYLKLTTDFDSIIVAYKISKECKLEKYIKNELSLKEIDNLKEELFKNNPYISFIGRELSTIYRIFKEKYNEEEINKISKSWIPMYKFRKEDKDKFNIRNFLAHGGLEKSVTEIYINLDTNNEKDREKIFNNIKLRYCKDFIKKNNDIVKFIYSYLDKKTNKEEKTNILEKLEKVMLNT